jgi:hypothetical protein
MKYNRINIKWWLVSTSFKIYLDILSNLYIMFTIFYYNIATQLVCFHNMHNSDPTPQGVENRNIRLWFKCVLTALHVNCMILKIVKMKYNRIKGWLVSTSFKIYLDILSNLYITFTIFYYNTISLNCTFFPVLVKGLY